MSRYKLSLLYHFLKIMRSLLFLISTLVISLYIPLFLMVYFTPWYTLNTSVETRAYLGSDSLQIAHKNLTDFFLHQERLSPTLWSPSEIIHMHDVRTIYDQTVIIFILALITTTTLWTKQRAKKAFKKNIFLPLFLLLLLPFFSYFWSTIFHNILFTNDFWITTPSDLSYYLFPLPFFIKSLIGVTLSASAINLALYAITKAHR